MLVVGDGETDFYRLEPCQGHDLTGGCLRHLDAIESLEREELRDTRLFNALRFIERHERYRIADVNRSARNATTAQPPEIRRVVDGGDEHLERTGGIAGRRGYMLDDRLE